MDPNPHPRTIPVGYSGLTLVFTSIATLMLGIIIGVGVMLFRKPSEQTAAGDASASAAPPAPPSASAPAPASAASSAPKVDPAAAAAAKKLAELQKKVKRSRAKQMDAECAKYHGDKLKAGYVFDGGKFEENKYVANAAGCQPVATSAKAPWFCCAK